MIRRILGVAIRMVPAGAIAGALTMIVACNPSTDGLPTISAAQLTAAPKQSRPLIVDVRTTAEFAAGHVPGAWNVPVDEVAARAEEIRDHAKGRDVVLYCQSGRRAGMAADALKTRGVAQLFHLDGDFAEWSRSGLPVERDAAVSP